MHVLIFIKTIGKNDLISNLTSYYRSHPYLINPCELCIRAKGSDTCSCAVVGCTSNRKTIVKNIVFIMRYIKSVLAAGHTNIKIRLKWAFFNKNPNHSLKSSTMCCCIEQRFQIKLCDSHNDGVKMLHRGWYSQIMRQNKIYIYIYI